MIYDAFMFRNEWDCLEIRLYELAEVVDRFVLVEGDHTFQGNPKPMHFAEHKERFIPFLDRLMHVKVAGRLEVGDAWERESMQRNGILQGLRDAKDSDVVLIGDADEIPRAEAVTKAANRLGAGESQVSFDQVLSFYHVDNVCFTAPWRGTQAVTAETAFARTPEGVRQGRSLAVPQLYGGWHYCNLGDPAWLIEKIESFSHSEVNLPEYKDPAFLAQCIAEGREMTGRSDILFRLDELGPDDMPAYLWQHRERFGHLFAGNLVKMP